MQFLHLFAAAAISRRGWYFSGTWDRWELKCSLAHSDGFISECLCVCVLIGVLLCCCWESFPRGLLSSQRSHIFDLSMSGSCGRTLTSGLMSELYYSSVCVTIANYTHMSLPLFVLCVPSVCMRHTSLSLVCLADKQVSRVTDPCYVENWVLGLFLVHIVVKRRERVCVCVATCSSDADLHSLICSGSAHQTFRFSVRPNSKLTI